MNTLKPISEVYPDLKDEGYFYGTSDYTPMLESLGHEVLLQVDDADYQGDTRVIFRAQDGRYGLLIFGWGSCSGCDSLQACNSIQEVEDLRASTANDIKWYDAAGLLSYLETHDWEGDYSWHEAEARQFVEQAKALMRDITATHQ